MCIRWNIQAAPTLLSGKMVICIREKIICHVYGQYVEEIEVGNCWGKQKEQEYCLNMCIETRASHHSLSLPTAVTVIVISVLSAVGAVRQPISHRVLLLWSCSDMLFSDPSPLDDPA